jgi:hypothetical protein
VTSDEQETCFIVTLPRQYQSKTKGGPVPKHQLNGIREQSIKNAEGSKMIEKIKATND